jgi:hypothetical protein
LPANYCNRGNSAEDSVTDYDAPVYVPAVFSLSQNYPNPFNAGTRIDFSAATAGDYELQVYDVLGRLVYSQSLPKLNAGEHSISLNNGELDRLASGVYLYKISGDGNRATKKMLLLK